MFELFDAKAAAFAMSRGHKLRGDRMDESGRVLFQFEQDGIRETLREFQTPGTQVEVQTVFQHYRYLMSLIEERKMERAS